MDLELFARVLWRHRRLVVTGLAIGLLLAVATATRVTWETWRPTLTYKEGRLWRSDVTLLVSQPGFPWGRSVFTDTVPVGSSGESVSRFADPSRLTSLAILYSHLAEGDEVRKVLLGSGRVNGSIDAAPVVLPGATTASQGYSLPMFTISGTSNTPARAMALAQRASVAFRTYLGRQAISSRIPRRERIEVRVIKSPSLPVVVSSPSLIGAIFTFMLLAFMTVAVVFIVENRRTRAFQRPHIADADAVDHDTIEGTVVSRRQQGALRPEPLAGEHRRQRWA